MKPRRPRSARVGAAGVPHTLATPPAPHDSVPLQVPQLAIVRAPPQLSGPETAPQFLPSRAQKAESVSGAQEQTLAAPPPPQDARAVQLPQLAVRLRPQESGAVTAPQFFASRLQNAASLSTAQPQTLAVPPPPQLCGAAHAPQLATVRGALQLSVPVSWPQLALRRAQNAGSDSATQPLLARWLQPEEKHDARRMKAAPIVTRRRVMVRVRAKPGPRASRLDEQLRVDPAGVASPSQETCPMGQPVSAGGFRGNHHLAGNSTL